MLKKNLFTLLTDPFPIFFIKTAVNLGKEVYLNEVSPGLSFDFEKVKTPKEIELVCFTHNETSTGVSLNLAKIKRFIVKGESTLFALDIVSSAPYVKVDFSFFDLVFFSVQKCFGLPSGLGVLIVGPRAFEKAEFLYKKVRNFKSYHDFMNLEKYSLLDQTPETPNVLNLYLLGKIVEDMRKKGITNIRRETEIKAKLIYEYYLESKYLKPAVVKDEDRSRTICVANINIDSAVLLSILKKDGFVIGGGYKEMKSKQMRIANFPATSATDMKNLIKSMKLGFNRI